MKHASLSPLFNSENAAPKPAPPDARLSCWLHTSRELLWELLNRRRILERLHPRKNFTVEDAAVLEAELEETETAITDLCKQLAVIENETPLLGAAALLRDPDDLHRNAVVALSLSRLSSTFSSDIETVGAMSGLAAGNDPAGALTIRDAFRETGSLRAYVHIERRNLNIDNWKIGLTETCLAQIFGREIDAELLAVSFFRETIKRGG